MSPRELVLEWVDAFDRRDSDALAALYAGDAVNHQVMEAPLAGRAAIRAMFAAGFAATQAAGPAARRRGSGRWRA